MMKKNAMKEEDGFSIRPSLTERHRKMIFSHLYAKCKNVEVAADLTQDTLLSAYIKISKGAYLEKGLLAPWLKEIALCKLRDHWRQNAQRSRSCNENLALIKDNLGIEESVLSLTVEECCEIENRNKKRYKELEGLLPHNQQLAIQRCYWEMKSIRQAAKDLSVNESTFGGYCRRGLRNLKKIANQKGICLKEILLPYYIRKKD